MEDENNAKAVMEQESSSAMGESKATTGVEAEEVVTNEVEESSAVIKDEGQVSSKVTDTEKQKEPETVETETAEADQSLGKSKESEKAIAADVPISVVTEEEEEDEMEDGDIVIPLGYLLNEEGSPTPYPGVFSLFLTDTTLDRVGIPDLNDDSEIPYRYVEKDVVLKDISFRGKISDFQIIKADIEKAAVDSLMIRVNTDNIYGDDNNFEVATVKEVCEEWATIHKLTELKKKRDAEEKANSGKEKPKKRKPRKKKEKVVPVSKPWVSQGSEIEIMESKTKQTREKISVSFARALREFNQSLEFTDKDAQELWNGSQMECRPYKDVKFDLQRMQFDAGCQSVGERSDKEVQATRLPLVNKSTQYEARSLSRQVDVLDRMESPSFMNFLKSVESRFDDALQQNEVMNIFEDDFAALADEDSAPGNRSEATISEYQSFTHLTYSKNKLVSSIDWLPNRRGIVAVATTEPLSFDERIAQAGRVRTSAILIWNFKDPIHPQCVLESPSDIMCFRFNEDQPELVAGGMYNGQVVLWDTTPSNKTTKKRGEDGDEEASIPVIKCKYLSAIETSHTYPVSDLCWMKNNSVVDGTGNLVDVGNQNALAEVDGKDNEENSTTRNAMAPGSRGQAYMFLTTSADGRVLFWDTLPKKDSKKGDIVWTPKYSIRLSRLEKGGHLGCSKLSLAVGSKFFCGSHDGEVAYVDYKAGDSADYPDHTKSVTDGHFGPVNALDRSPFFSDIVLSTGDWTFKVWKEGINSPIYSSPCSAAYLTTGCWSPTRPGVIYTARTDGVLEVWDLLDRSHEPSMTVSASSASITAVEFLKEKESSMTQRMAIGDRQGVLHIMDVPRNLRKAAVGEKGTMSAFFDRELKRVDSMNIGLHSGSAAGSHTSLSAAPAMKGSLSFQSISDSAFDMEKQEEEYLTLERDFMTQLGLERESALMSLTAQTEIQAN